MSRIEIVKKLLFGIFGNTKISGVGFLAIFIIFGFTICVVKQGSNKVERITNPPFSHSSLAPKTVVSQQVSDSQPLPTATPSLRQRGYAGVIPSERSIFIDYGLGIGFEYHPNYYIARDYSSLNDYRAGLITITKDSLFKDVPDCTEGKNQESLCKFFNWWNPEITEPEQVLFQGKKAQISWINLPTESYDTLKIIQILEEPHLEITADLRAYGYSFLEQRLFSTWQWLTNKDDFISYEESDMANWTNLTSNKLGVSVKYPPDIIDIGLIKNIYPPKSEIVVDADAITLSYKGPTQALETEFFDGYFVDLELATFSGTMEEVFDKKLSGWKDDFTQEITQHTTSETTFKGKKALKFVTETGYSYQLVETNKGYLYINYWFSNEPSYETKVNQILETITFF